MLTSPKRTSDQPHGPARWFGYYAGYAPAFVDEAITYLDLPKHSIIADPWNGSGTTTEVVHDRGLIGRGYDINPAIVLVAKARLLKSDIKPSHLSLCDTLIREAGSFCDPQFLEEEPLAVWFAPASAGVLRGLERSLQYILLPDGRYRRYSVSSTLSDVSCLAAFFYVALFRTTRSFLKSFLTSNPTWIKEPAAKCARLRPAAADIMRVFRAEVRSMFDVAGPSSKDSMPTRSTVDIGDSTNLPLSSGSVDGIISSPPYCTRIDYAIATWPELAVLGATRFDLQRLRNDMIGTPLTGVAHKHLDARWGVECNSLLTKIKAHPSKASATYYYRNHVQYFDRLHHSFREIARILRPDGQCVLVVQDSYYKSIHTNLQRITTEMFDGLGFSLGTRRDHHLRHTKAMVNSRHRKYRAQSHAQESVLAFVKN